MRRLPWPAARPDVPRRASALARRALAMLPAALLAGEAVALAALRCRGAPPACPGYAEDLLLLGLALGLWHAALRARMRAPWRAAWPLLLGAAALGAGCLARAGSPTAARIALALLPWGAPALLDVVLSLGRVPEGAARAPRRWAFAAALVLSAAGVLRDEPPPHGPGLWSLLTLAACAGAALAGARRLRRTASATGRRIRLAGLGLLVGALPALLLGAVPRAVGAPLTSPASLAVPGALLGALLYVEALGDGAADARRLRVAATAWLLATAYAAVALAAVSLLLLHGSPHPARWGALAVGAAALTALTAPRAWGALEGLVGRLWYGLPAGGDLLGGLAEALALTADRGRLQRLLVHDLRRVAGLAGAALYWPEGGRLALVSADGWGDAAPPPELPVGGALAAQVLSAGPVVGAGELRAALDDAAARGEEGGLLGDPRAALWLPLVADGELQALLVLGSREGGQPFSRRDLATLGTLAHQSAVAAHTVHLVEALRAEGEELARAHRRLLEVREEERRALAQDLHDGAVQEILWLRYRLAAQADALRGGAGADLAEADLLDGTRDDLLRIVTRLREQIRALRPAGPEPQGLPAALARMARSLCDDHGPEPPRVDVSVPEGLALPLPLEAGLFRIAQEGLRNALTHAGARSVAVRLEADGDGWLTLSVADDGCGFVVPADLGAPARAGHYGLVGMAERAAGLGGALAVESAPGRGTRLVVRVPMAEEEQR